MLYHIVYSICYLLSLLPYRVLYVLSDMMYPLVYYVVRYRRKIVRKNLTNSFPEKKSEEILKIEHEFYHFFCDYFVETIKALTVKKEEMMKRMVFENVDETLALYSNKQFIFLYLGHFCNWELIASLKWWMPKNWNTGQLYAKLHSDLSDRLFYTIRSRYGGENINKKEALRRIVKISKTDEKILIGFISDQGPKRDSIHLWVDFLHQDTPVFTGTERIAKKVDAAILYAEVKRRKRGYYTCRFKPITDNPKAYGEHELTRIFMSLLEKDIKADPPRWLWSHNRWKRKREE